MKTITVEELQKDFYQILDQVESGESFLITSSNGNVAMIPCNDKIYNDELIEIYTNHEEGC